MAAAALQGLLIAAMLVSLEAKSCYVCSDCPMPLITTKLQKLGDCASCAVTNIMIGARNITIRHCLTKGLTCERFKSTYYPPYSIQKLAGANSTTYDIVSVLAHNITHSCCDSDLCNTAGRTHVSLVPALIGSLCVLLGLTFFGQH